MTLLLLLALVQTGQDASELTHFGNKWGWTATDEAFVPQLVMYATPPNFHGDPDKVDRDIQTLLIGHGFHGFHVFMSCRWFDIEEEDCRKVPGKDPAIDPRTLDALEMLITKTHRTGGMVHLWMWGDEERGQTPSARTDWGGLDGPVARKLEAAVAKRLGPLPGWSMGYGFDLDEWVDASELEAWRDRMHRLMPRFHFLGGRPAGPNRRGNHRAFASWNDGLDYASYEHHKPSYTTYSRALDATPDKPVLSEDRFRVLESTDSKHYSLQETRRGLWHSTLAGGVGNIWGYLMEGGSHELGSAPYPNRGQIKTYFEFTRGRFRKDMTRCSRIDARPDRRSVCLRADAGQHYIVYKENTERVELDLDSMVGRQPVIAVDAKRPYAEIPAGMLEPGRHDWNAPHRSDWALGVGRFARGPAPQFVSPLPTPRPAGAFLVTSGYPILRLGEGDRYYSDRNYTLAVVPDSLDDAIWIRTANDEKTSRRDALITFELAKDSVVYVGFDRRAVRLPDWLGAFERAGQRVHVNGDGMGYFELYRKRFEKGSVTLGGTSARGSDFGDGGRSQYIIAIVAVAR